MNFSLSETVRQTIQHLRDGNMELAKATFGNPTTSTGGLQLYNLDEAVRTMVPRYTPLRNSIPRVGGHFARQANWKAVTAIDSANTPIGVPDGTRNQEIGVNIEEYNAVFKTFSVEASSTFQGQWASQGVVENAQEKARKTGSHKYIVGEELVILGGNTTGTGIALGTPVAPTVVPSNSGGNIGAGTYNVIVVAGTLDSWKTSSLAGGVATVTSVQPADGSSAYSVKRGSSNKSAATSTGALSGSANKIVASTTAIRGAVVYYWFVGTAGNEKLEAMTATNTVTLTALAGTGQAASAISTDNSQDQYVCDGIITQISKPTSNGYWKSLDGVKLTPTGKGGIVEFDELLVDRYVNYKVSSFEIIMSAHMATDASQAMRTGSVSTPLAFNITSEGQASMIGGGRHTGYIHPITGEVLPIVVHPDMPDGTIIFRLLDIGAMFEDDRVPNVWQMAMRQDVFSIEWPIRTLKYEIAVVGDGVLQGYFPAGNGILACVGRS